MSFTMVVGCHRSGTSLLAGLLHHSGIDFGKRRFKPKPNKGNPRGYYEDVYFRNINDDILKFNRYDVKSWETNIPSIKANKSLRKQISGILAKRRASKDPRYCLTWHIWQKHLPKDTTVYYIYRHPVAVARSLRKRNSISIEQALEIWNVYNSRALGITDHFDTVVVSYEDLLAQGSVKTIGIEDSKNLIDPKLNRNGTLGTVEIPDFCRENYQTLKLLTNS